MVEGEYSDYILTFWGHDERAFKDTHIRIVKPKKTQNSTRTVTCLDGAIDDHELASDVNVPAVKFKGFKFRFGEVMNWSFRTKFAPWKKLDIRHPVRSLLELTRTKRIGHLHYKLPCDQVCNGCPKFKDRYPNCYPDLIDPIHFSKLRQPSGRNVDEPIEWVPDPRYPPEEGKKTISLVEIVTPKMLKDRMENTFLRAAVGSVKYGAMKKLGSKWMIFMVIGIVAFVLLLYFSGNLPMGGR